MAYNANIYQRAIHVLERRRESANIDARIRFDEISEKLPELMEIQDQLAQVGFSISKAFLYADDKPAEMERLKKLSLKLQDTKKKILKENGYNEDALSVQYSCPVCSDTGFVGQRMCNCHRELLKEIQRNDLRKCAPLDECTFETFDTKYYPECGTENGISPRSKAERILESCRRYATGFTLNKPANLILFGQTGLGKTHLSLAIANVAVNRGYSVLYGTAQNILSDLQNENFGRTDNLNYTEREVLQTELLVLDDLGTEFSGAYSIACLYNIINTRLLSKRPTIISTNLTHDELSDKYDQRITSRISGEYSQLILEGNDIRYIK